MCFTYFFPWWFFVFKPKAYATTPRQGVRVESVAEFTDFVCAAGNLSEKRCHSRWLHVDRRLMIEALQNLHRIFTFFLWYLVFNLMLVKNHFVWAWLDESFARLWQSLHWRNLHSHRRRRRGPGLLWRPVRYYMSMLQEEKPPKKHSLSVWVHASLKQNVFW